MFRDARLRFSVAVCRLPHRGLKDNNGRRKRSGLGAAAELETPLQKLDFTSHREIVPPLGVRAGRDEAHHSCSAATCFPRLFHPAANGSAIGWVHPACPTPFLCKPIVFRGKEPGRFRVGWQGADVEVEMEDVIVFCEEVLRRLPRTTPGGLAGILRGRLQFKPIQQPHNRCRMPFPTARRDNATAV